MNDMKLPARLSPSLATAGDTLDLNSVYALYLSWQREFLIKYFADFCCIAAFLGRTSVALHPFYSCSLKRIRLIFQS
jgi:hypothetical protein